ncbi:uncharacterized protein F5891DRAFT_987469 [Suillus fuscotomentosus]|uniref:Uncharacterized protein n=1 Tax=Suillus fuscotomentosus TaxID=1912939 RepID=A0AAD4DQ59_9AGAM|nr:uncharacterized protein F5891DRAFT_987469 [Suillus fuscotomentosus]KAG1889090.1 hypothetical protein F5891DRAFT_987469 [Suillus fuscotomentosus]
MEPQNVSCYFFGETHPTILPLTGGIIGGSEGFHFAGYLTIPPRPVLYPLYLKLEITLLDYLVTSTQDHNPTYELNNQGKEVPIYIDRRGPAMTLDWEIAWYKQGPNKIHRVYQWDNADNGNKYKTLAYSADYPMGYVPASASASCFQSAPFSPHAPYSLSAPFFQPGSYSSPGSFSSPEYNYSLAQFSDLFGATANLSASPEIEVAQEMTNNTLAMVEPLTSSRKQPSVVPGVYLSAPQSPVGSSVNLRSPMDSAPESWIMSSAMDASSIQVDDGAPQPVAPETAVHADTLHTILPDYPLWRDTLVCLQLKMKVKANSLKWLLEHKIIKSLIYYFIYHASTTSSRRVVISNEEPAIFLTAQLPPMEMVAFFLTIWYSALLARLIELIKAMRTLGLPVNIMMATFPPASTIYAEVLTNDPAYPDLLEVLASMCNIDSGLFSASASFTPSTRHFLAIEHTEHALKYWLQTQGREIVPDPLFATTSVLFGWVDPLDLIAVLQRMYRAQLEVSLFSKAIANLCEELKTRCCPSTWSRTQLIQKAEEDLVASQVTQLANINLLPHGLPRHGNLKWISHKLTKFLSFMNTFRGSDAMQHDNDFLSPLMQAWFGCVTYRTYITTSSADSKSICIDNTESFKAKKNKMPDALKSDFSILELKKQRAQAEVDMFSEVIAHTAGIQYSDDGTFTSRGTAGTFESHLPANSSKWFDYWFEDWCSTSSRFRHFDCGVVRDPIGTYNWSSVTEDDYHRTLIMNCNQFGRAMVLHKIRHDLTVLSVPPHGSPSKSLCLSNWRIALGFGGWDARVEVYQNISHVDRLFHAANDFHAVNDFWVNRTWPLVTSGVGHLWDQFRLYVGLLVNPAVYCKPTKDEADDNDDNDCDSPSNTQINGEDTFGLAPSLKDPASSTYSVELDDQDDDEGLQARKSDLEEQHEEKLHLLATEQ